MTIRVAIVGVGNCASALVQGLGYYDGTDNNGLMKPDIAGFKPSDVEVVCAFDVDARKVGQAVGQAIFAEPNCCYVFNRNTGCMAPVYMGPVLDGVAPHMAEQPAERTFIVSNSKPVNVAQVMRHHKVDVMVCYLPVGSQLAVEYYMQAALMAGVAVVNCIPVFIASNKEWAKRFVDAELPIIGDDIKSQVGATIVHRVLAKLMRDRGYQITRTYQLNTGGNTDFLNMLARDRLASKKKSKTGAVTSQIDVPMRAEDVHIGPSDYVPWQGDNKVAFIRLEGKGFGDAPFELELRMSVQDSPNSAGVVMDAIRFAAYAKQIGVKGPLIWPSAYFMKTPPIQYEESLARDKCASIASRSNPFVNY